MPHFYAHRVFGEQVWLALPHTLRQRLARGYPAFRLGLYGPDPLFFHSLRRSDPVIIQGLEQHRLPPERTLEAFRGQEKHPQAVAYAGGWLCHYMLDRACHPLIMAACGGHSLSHAAIELALDRRLKARYPLPREESYPPSAFAAAVIPCPGVTPQQFQGALRGFYRFSKSTATLYHGRGDPALQAKLIARLTGAVPLCAGLVCRLVDCLEGDKSLDWLPRENFYGRVVIPEDKKSGHPDG